MKKAYLAALVIMGAFVLGGCGKGDATAEEAAALTGTAAPEQTAAPEVTAVPEATVPELSEIPKSEADNLYEERPVSLKRMEALGRGFVAVDSPDGMFLSWRFLGTDAENIAFNVYRNGVRLNEKPITDVTSFVDTSYSKADKETIEYTLVPVREGSEAEDEISEALVFGGEYLSVPVKQYEVGDYDINDASVGDLDGDGEYEIVVRREPADMDVKTRAAYPLIEAYELDGTYMWTINIGPNEICTIDINFVVYDMNGDGKAEVVMRSFEGTVDGEGSQIGDEDGDGITDYSIMNGTVIAMKDRSYLFKGPEFLSMYDGETGKEIARTDLLPSREPLESWYQPGDTGKRVKRASHYALCVAYLDGEKPSIVHFRGAWAACKVAAYDVADNDFAVRWSVDCESEETLDNLYNTGYHSIAVADVDYDGRDEIITGGAAVDDDGSILYVVTGTKEDGTKVKLGHGDAFDVAVMSPDTHEYFAWACRETPNLPVNIGLHSGLTGEVLFGQTKPKDTGRSRAADVDPTSRGWELWGSTATPLQSFAGEVLSDTCPNSMNMKMYWDGDLLAELVDHDGNHAMNILKWDWTDKKLKTILTAAGSASNGGTKGQTCLIADIFGDWREELVVRTADNTEMRIYSTSIATEYRIPTLMHDVTYREAVCWQNNHYNQPANTSFYFGAETERVPVPEIYTIDKDGRKAVAGVYEQNPGEHAFFQIKQ
ncbi:MAG: carbohydrate-binding protein [Lachnospiraceae bacterium]|nr:carbohydrate-binding protein [Lachnospiraceae bacterium]